MVRFWFLKAIGGPGSLHFLFFATIGALGLMWIARTRRIGRLILIGLWASYGIMSIPAVSHVIAGPATVVHADSPAQYEKEFGKIEEIFVIDGDNYEARAAFTAALARSVSPRNVWVVGGGELRDALVANGVSNDLWRWAGGSSRTTYDQMLWIKKYIAEEKIQRPVLVASRVQTPRIAGIARQQGMDVIVIPSPLDDEPAVSGVWNWIPSYSALKLSRDGLYEQVALAYYRRKGWL